MVLEDLESHVQVLQLSIGFDENADLDGGIVRIEEVLVVALYLVALVDLEQVSRMLSLILRLPALKELVKLDCSVRHLESYTQIHEVVDDDRVEQMLTARALLGGLVCSLAQIRRSRVLL